jgi:hypothetical protein
VKGATVARAAALAGIAALCGCAYIGNVQPPALEIPVRVTDLRAAEFGGNILVQFTLPALTTEGLALTEVKDIELRVTSGASSQALKIPPKGPGPVQFEFPARDYVDRQITLSVRAMGPKGKASDWSNPVALAVRTPLEAPRDVKAEPDPRGVRLTWTGSAMHYRVFRATGQGGMPEIIGQSDAREYEDTTAEFGTSYRYFVQAADGDERQSELSQAVTIAPADIFPPAVPAGVSAVAGVDSIELAWERNTEEDFAGYNIYRSVNGGPFEKIAAQIEAPTYSDRQVMSGVKYAYAITAVDRVGNESARSMPAEITAP